MDGSGDGGGGDVGDGDGGGDGGDDGDGGGGDDGGGGGDGDSCDGNRNHDAVAAVDNTEDGVSDEELRD